MDTITQDTLAKVGDVLDNLDINKTGPIHTVKIELDGRTGGAEVTVEASLTDDMIFTVL